MTHRRREALRELAERPGSPAEGQVARKKLAEFDAKYPDVKDGTSDNAWPSRWNVPEYYHCQCGERLRMGTKCTNIARHEQIRQEIKVKFPKGARVYYNHYVCSPANKAGTVIGYPTPKSRGYEQMYADIRIKFDDQKSVLRVRIYSHKGWHLSTEPATQEECDRLRQY